MRAVVLVGGFGTRLRPLTNTIPKSMLPVGHVPMIARLIGRLARGGVDDVVLALGFKPEPFLEAFPDGRCAGATLTYAVEPEPLDTAGAIAFAARHGGIDETFVVANGDVMTSLDVAAMIDAHRSHRAEATIHLIGVEEPSAYGVVELGVDDRIVRFVEKPEPGTEPSNLINAGTYVLEPSVIDRIPAGRPMSVERVVFPAISADGGLFGHVTDDYWIDAGRSELYLAANLDLLAGGPAGESCVPIADGAAVDDHATVTNSVVGAGACIEGDTTVVDSVVLPGAVIRHRAQVESSVVMGEVGAEATVIEAMVGENGVVAPGDVLAHAAVPDPAVPTD